MTKRPAVFLDRDGVLNQAVVRGGRPYPPDTLGEVVILAGVAQAISRLKKAGYAIVVVTNQPDVATGKQSRKTVEEINAYLGRTLGIDLIKVCYCVEGDGCDCYKPKPGMLLEAAGELSLDLKKSFMVGDRWRDVGAGKNAGCGTFFIDYGYREQRPDDPDYSVSSLAQAVDIILAPSR